MFTRFRIRRSSSGKFGFQHVPVYSMRDWHIDISDRTGILCRPSHKTLGRRLIWSLQPVALLAVLFLFESLVIALYILSFARM